MASKKRVYKTTTLPYTDDDYKAAEEWIEETCFEADSLSADDSDAVIESLAKAFAQHVEAHLGQSKPPRKTPKAG